MIMEVEVEIVHMIDDNDTDDNDDDDDDDEGDEYAYNDRMGMYDRTKRPHSIWQKSRYGSGSSSESLPGSSSGNANHNHQDQHSNFNPNALDVLQHDFLRKYPHFAETRWCFFSNYR